MADCFSLPNAAELVETLRKEARTEVYDTAVLMLTASDAIEADRMEIAGLRMRRDELYKKIDQLEAENARLQAERDAAVADLKYSRVCFTCKHRSGPDCDGCHVNLNRWEWRGVQKESE